jgi:hypothetical protein
MELRRNVRTLLACKLVIDRLLLASARLREAGPAARGTRD